MREFIVPPLVGYGLGPYPLLLVGGILDGVARRCI